jgi:hypothetical protein
MSDTAPERFVQAVKTLSDDPSATNVILYLRASAALNAGGSGRPYPQDAEGPAAADGTDASGLKS